MAEPKPIKDCNIEKKKHTNADFKDEGGVGG